MLTQKLGVMFVKYDLGNGPTTSRYQVDAWKNFGVVCPGRITTDGSADYLADRLVRLWERYDCKWVSDLGLPGPAAGKEAFANALHDAYIALRDQKPSTTAQEAP